MTTVHPPLPVLFRRADGQVVRDKIRAFFIQTVCLEPYAPNEKVVAAVLTQHSWTPVENIVEYMHP